MDHQHHQPPLIKAGDPLKFDTLGNTTTLSHHIYLGKSYTLLTKTGAFRLQNGN